MKVKVIALGVFMFWRLESGWETYNFFKSVIIFHASFFYNSWINGIDFNFTPILESSSCKNVERDAGGKIIKITDGKHTPLILGSIPFSKNHLILLQTQSKPDSSKNPIAIFSLNRSFERKWAGLSTLVEEQKHQIRLYSYPTTDFTVPSLETAQHIIQDLENRDALKASLAYVHCKAGKGRSVFCVAAYLLHVCNQAGEKVTVEEIITYLKELRPHISLSEEHRNALKIFELSVRS